MLKGTLEAVLLVVSFNFFTQARGPEIDLDLFPRARQMGAQTGNLIKTPLEAGIEGAITGIKTGFNLAEQYQQIQLRQNEIEQLPVQNRNEAAIASINESKAYILENSREEALALEQTKLQQEVADINNRKELSQILANPDPAIRATVFKNPKYTDLFTRDSKLFQYALGASKEGLGEDEFASLSSSLNLFKQRDYEIAKNEQNAEYLQKLLDKRDKAIDNFQGSSAWSQFTQGMSDREIRDQIEVKKPVLKDTAGNDIVAPGDEFEVVKNGTVVGTVTSSEADKFTQYKAAQDAWDRSQKKQIYGAPDPMQQAQAALNQQKSEATGAIQSPEYQNRISSFSSELGQPNTFGAPLQTEQQSQGTSSVVEQARKQYEEIAKNPPSGMDQKTINDRLMQQKAARKAGLAKTAATPEAKSQQTYDLVSQVTKGTTIPVGGFTTISTKTVTSPSAKVSQVAQVPVTLNFNTNFSVDPVSYEKVQSNPLLNNEPPLWKGLAYVESGGVTDAVSPTGVRGLFQVTRSTAAQYGLNRDIPEEGKLAAKLYLTDLYSQSKENIALALAGYNAGPSNIQKAVDDAGTTDWNIVKDFLKPYVSEAKFKEVYEYPDKVLSAATQFMGKNPQDDKLFYALLQVSNLVQPQLSEA